ncbi:MAG: hypothetical protein MK138_08325, partial [Planctomycetes bacterium]|nr:hypothetical protein [Planctomycetota bacterium]
MISEAEHTLLGPKRQVHSVSFSHDGRLVVCSARGIRVWKPGTGFDEIFRLGGRTPVYSVSCSATSSLMASAGGDGVASLWDLRTTTEGVRLRGHRGWIHDVAFSPDGLLVASAGSDGTVKLWDIASGTERETLSGHCKAVRCVVFSPDGKRLA